MWDNALAAEARATWDDLSLSDPALKLDMRMDAALLSVGAFADRYAGKVRAVLAKAGSDRDPDYCWDLAVALWQICREG
ncbi:hypothetical protein HW932_20935 [Allochromatium humboldtianum]|uniref:Uncharacterized protein n=1 Tax=Allochromatium humboldtianum TaxID=504901 RepID=A0A850RHR1_9GAMM|nr:hypothetical protein [Allochromatium humboldtianum]NVZ11716.1 hypothetical protein [Allochromatium humboldtianum]